MPFATYVAAESLISGHVASVTYSLNFSVQSADPSVKTKKSVPESLSGATEVLYWGRVKKWSIVMEPMPAEQCGQIEEFLDSVANGQVFTFDPYGWIENTKKPLQVKRTDDEYSVRRLTQTGDPLYSDRLEYSFEVTEI